MHHFFLVKIIALLTHYGYVLLFPIAIIEGPVAAIIGGALVASGEFDGVVVFIILLVADLVGDALYYALGRYGTGTFFKNLGLRLGITEASMEPLRQQFKANDWKLILIGKTQALGSVILYFAGSARMSFVRFMAWNLVGTVPKVIIFEVAGFFFGQSILSSQRYINQISITAFGAATGLLILYWIFKKYAEREAQRGINPAP